MTVFTKKKISRSYSLGEILLRSRRKQGLNLSDVERATKISQKYLSALENNDFLLLPAAVYTKGFIAKYADFLNLKAPKLLALYDIGLLNLEQADRLRVNNKKRSNIIRPDVIDEVLNGSKHFIITPELLWGTSVGFGLLSILGFIWLQVSSFAAAPPLEITNPANELVVAVETIEISGITDEGAILAINDQPVAVDESGRFRQEVKLADGVNTIRISAKNKVDKETTKVIQVLADFIKE